MIKKKILSGINNATIAGVERDVKVAGAANSRIPLTSLRIPWVVGA
jgi:hypothetical protein